MPHAWMRLIFLPLLLLLPTTGCFTAIKQAYHEARGAQAEVKPIQAGDGALAGFNEVRFAPATASVGPKFAPPALLRAYDAAVAGLRTDLGKHYPGGAPALNVETEVLYFQEKGLLSGAQMLSRVRMGDAGRVVVDALVLAESKSFRAGGEDDLAKATVNALREFLQKQKGAPAKDAK